MKTIRELRIEQGWTQFDLASTIGVQPSTIYNWESGRYLPDVIRLRALARTFDVSMDDIAFVGVDVDRDGNPLEDAEDEEPEQSAA